MFEFSNSHKKDVWENAFVSLRKIARGVIAVHVPGTTVVGL